MITIDYKTLSPEDKLQVLSKWMAYRIEKTCTNILRGSTRKIKIIPIERFYVTCCPELHPTGKGYAIKRAEYCYYCASKMLPKRQPGDPYDPKNATVDHFFPRKHPHRKKQIFVISCHECNAWKDCKHPENILHLMKNQHPSIPITWGITTATRIEGVLSEVKSGAIKKCYYL